jgi:hypothetical protein
MAPDYHPYFIKLGLDPVEGMKWAFGENYEGIPIAGSHLLWNERHGDLFKLQSYGVINSGLGRIAEAYKKHLDEK